MQDLVYMHLCYNPIRVEPDGFNCVLIHVFHGN